MRQRPTRWTDELDEYLFVKFTAGDPLRTIAAAIGCSPDAVRHRYAKLCKWRGLVRVDRRKLAA